MRGTQVGEIHVEIHIVWIQQNGLPQGRDGLWCFLGIFVRSRSQFEDFAIRTTTLQHWLECQERVLRLVRH